MRFKIALIILVVFIFFSCSHSKIYDTSSSLEIDVPEKTKTDLNNLVSFLHGYYLMEADTPEKPYSLDQSIYFTLTPTEKHFTIQIITTYYNNQKNIFLHNLPLKSLHQKNFSIAVWPSSIGSRLSTYVLFLRPDYENMSFSARILDGDFKIKNETPENSIYLSFTNREDAERVKVLLEKIIDSIG